ncbi:MAG TPA: inner membrane CreD family protein [Anaeromyxobacter sp.]|nr:inner membrane CreD family protein [Anaeromyxobacter sp.]
MRRLLAIGFVWLASSVAWAVLGSTLTVRSGDKSGQLLPEVHALWGPELVQAPPTAFGTETHPVHTKEQRYDEKEKRYFTVERDVEVTTERAMTLEASDLDATIALEHRRKGLLWFPTYAVDFRGTYAFRNDTSHARTVTFKLPLEKRGVTYDGFAVVDAAGKAVDVVLEDGVARFARPLMPKERAGFGVSYRTRGTARWGYGTFGGGLGPEQGRARSFRLTVATNFPNVDFQPGTLSPTTHGPVDGGWRGTWRFDQIVGTEPVAILLPERLNPGPLAARITFFAPVSLLFFCFVIGILLAARGRSIHPMNYFLFACAFFAFHLLFAYLIDHVAVGQAFAAASLVSVGLAVSYARLFMGWRAALLHVGLAQLLYLVLFSFSFFWRGFTGLAITIGAILTLFVIMQLTGRLDWERVLSGAAPGGAGTRG